MHKLFCNFSQYRLLLCKPFVQYSKSLLLLYSSQPLCLFYHIVKKKAIYLSFDICCNVDEFCLSKLSIFIKYTSVPDDCLHRFLCIFAIYDNLYILSGFFGLLYGVLLQNPRDLFDHFIFLQPEFYLHPSGCRHIHLLSGISESILLVNRITP